MQLPWAPGTFELLGFVPERELGGETQDRSESAYAGVTDNGPLVSVSPTLSGRRATSHTVPEATRPLRVLRNRMRQSRTYGPVGTLGGQPTRVPTRLGMSDFRRLPIVPTSCTIPRVGGSGCRFDELLCEALRKSAEEKRCEAAKNRICGCSSVVERHVANVNVVSSNLITRLSGRPGWIADRAFVL